MFESYKQQLQHRKTKYDHCVWVVVNWLMRTTINEECVIIQFKLIYIQKKLKLLIKSSQ